MLSYIIHPPPRLFVVDKSLIAIPKIARTHKIMN